MKMSMATVSLGGTLEDKLVGIAAAGFDGIELLDDDLARSSLSAEDVRSRCADLGLAIDLYQPFRGAEGVAPERFPAVVERFRGELEIMRRLGTPSILVVSNTDDDADPSRDLSVEQLARLADIAGEYGVSVTFEALAWGTHISRVADARDVIRSADHPNIALVVDTFHLLAGGENVDILDDIPGYSVGYVQVADAPWLAMDLKLWSRGHRCFPGDGEMDLIGPLAALVGSGYGGPLSLEIFNPDYREQPPGEVARRGALALRGLVEDLEARTPLRTEASG